MRPTPRTLLVAMCALAALGAAPRPAAAQVRASERATISQVVDGTQFTIDYARPRARGRPEIFGRVVHWGEVWTPGANWATTLEVSRDVTLDGHAVKKGKYSVWFIVQREAWTVVLDPRFQRYHTEIPDSTADQVRWTVRPAAAPATEILTWSFPEVRPDGAELRLEWGDRRVAINATVAPTHPLTISGADAAPFVGIFEWKWDGDTASTRTEFYYERGMLLQRHVPAPAWYPLLQGQPMVRINEAWFIPAIVRDGKVWEMVADMVFEFTVTDGKAVSFELRDDRDSLMGTGRRVP